MKSKGAGGTPGGTGQFIVGFLMMCAGFYLLLQSIVTQPIGFGMGLYHVWFFGGMASITSGMILLPMMLGIGIIFYNARNIAGWALAVGSLVALVAGVLMNLHFMLRPMSLFELLCILVLAIGGLGLFLRSLHDGRKSGTDSAEPG